MSLVAKCVSFESSFQHGSASLESQSWLFADIHLTVFESL